MAEQSDGALMETGEWRANAGSKFRSLNRDEVFDLRTMAEKTTPSFDGPNNAKFEDHHPLAREIWAKRGIGTDAKGVKP
jgi:hypothetical protein